MNEDFVRETESLIKLINTQGHDGEIVWTFTDDFAWNGRTLSVLEDRLEENRSLAELLFKSPNAAEYGVELQVVTVCEGRAYCSIWTTDSRLEADERMLHGIKLKVRSRFPETRIVRSALKWKICKLGERCPSLVADLLSKGEAERLAEL